MGRSWQGWMLAMLALAPPARAQNGGPVFAVLPFENAGSYGQDKEVFQALELGIPASIGSALASHPGVTVADAGKVRQALQSQGLGPNQHIDASTAAQVAKAVGARYTVTGSFADFYGKFRINARLVDAQSGKIVKVVSNDDPKLQDRARLSAIAQAVTEKLVKAAGLPPFPDEAAARASAVPTDALNQFSRGLLFESRGDKVKAAEWYQRALDAYPDYGAARDGLRRVQGS